MYGSTVVTSAPAAEPLTLTQAKAQLRIDDTDSDTPIAELIAVARDHVQQETGTYLVTQSVRVKCDYWEDLETLPFAPVQSITSISYVDSAGDAQTLSTDVYEARLDGLTPSIALKNGQAWPVIQVGSLISIVAVVGYGAPGSQPPSLLHAMKLILGNLHENAGDASAESIPEAARMLMQNYRRFM